MLHNFPFYLTLILTIIALVMVATKLKVAYPILLVLAGLCISFIPGVPPLRIDPELIFLIFLPPLLYDAAWAISWKELWKWRRIITSFAFIVVFLSAFAVAITANYFIPGFTLALGFLLGGIVSPPDAVSAGAILKFVKVPKRLASILEGESLLNDASSLIIFRFALITIGAGQFIFLDAAVSFAWMVIGGVGIGLLIACLFYKAHKLLPTDVNMDIVLTLAAPYIMYIGSEAAHASGVLSVVSGGLFLANRRHLFLSSAGRLNAASVWESLCFILNGLVFMLIGLDLPEIVSGLNGISLPAAIGYGVLVTGVLVIGRILSAFGAVVVTLIMRNFITVAEMQNPGVKGPFILGWAGMRGVVSLAAALSIPLQLSDGTPFPHRNLILFITFVVILLTLVGQGLTLPFIIRKLNLPGFEDDLPEDEHYRELHRKLTRQSVEYLQNNYADRLATQLALQQLMRKWEESNQLLDNEAMASENREVYLHLINQQRIWLREWNKDHAVDEEVVRKHQHRLDLEEERLRFM